MDKVRFLMSDTGAQITAACREALEQKGVDVTVVEKDGNKVLQKMLAVRPQVVLLDAFMPGLDALAVKQRYNAAGERHTSFFVTGSFQSEEMVQELLDEARKRYDYIMIDSPAGLGQGFQLATCGADRALVVSTNDASSLRDAQRTVAELDRLDQIHLVMNRIQPKLLRQLRTTIDDAMDTAGLPLLGVVPEDPQVMLSANLGRPLILGGRQGAANACLNIAKRLEGRRVPIMRIR